MFFCIFQGKRVPSVLSIYLVSGSLALIFYFIPSGQVALQVTVFVLCQGFMVGVFYMIGTYTQDVFSTDIRGTTFNFLDCMSKVNNESRKDIDIFAQDFK